MFFSGAARNKVWYGATSSQGTAAFLYSPDVAIKI
jgi:hypothetical protein